MLDIIKGIVYFVNMKSYGQYCALAKALDLVGDRWTLLIVRELLIREGSRYTDLRDGLPGIATNLLVNRLRDMERSGLVWREDAPPPIATTLFHLTSRGMELEEPLYQLGRWGAPLLANAPRKSAFRAHWLALPVRHWLKDHAPDQPRVVMELQTGGESITVEAVDGEIRTNVGPAAHAPDAVVVGKPRVLAALLVGKLNLAQAQASGLTYEGNPETLRRFQPLA